MPPKVQIRASVDIVEIESSDEEENPKTLPQNVPRQQQNNANTPSESVPCQQQKTASDSRSFWKAGNYEIGPTLMRSADEG